MLIKLFNGLLTIWSSLVRQTFAVQVRCKADISLKRYALNNWSCCCLGDEVHLVHVLCNPRFVSPEGVPSATKSFNKLHLRHELLWAELTKQGGLLLFPHYQSCVIVCVNVLFCQAIIGQLTKQSNAESAAR